MILIISGFGLIFLLSCIFGYQVSVFISILISLLGLVIVRSLLRNTFTTILSAVVLVLTGTISAFIMYKVGTLDEIIHIVIEFMKPYWSSLQESGDQGIDRLHQGIVILLISVLVYKILYHFKEENYLYYSLYFAFFALSVVGFLTGTMMSKRDEQGFFIAFLAMVIQFFHHFYRSKKHQLRNFRPYIFISAIVVLFVYGGSLMLYSMNPNPVHFPPKKVGAVASSMAPLKSQEEAEEEEKIQRVMLTQSGQVSNIFEPQGMELFRVQGSGVKYLKGAVFEQYDNGTWIPATEGKAYEDIPIFQDDSWIIPEQVTIQYTKIQSETLFIDDTDAKILYVPDLALVHQDIDNGIFSITNFDTIDPFQEFNYTYDSLFQLTGSRNYVTHLKNSTYFNLPFEFDESKYTLPKGYEDIRILAEEITQSATNDYERVQLIRKYFLDHFKYTREPNVADMGDTDPIRYFLFQSKEGFCQQFASAEVLMLQSLGLPARYVVGYIVPEMTEEEIMLAIQSGYFEDKYRVVTDSRAHAWVEVYYPGIGWETVEATPGFAPILMDTFPSGVSVESVKEEVRDVEIPVEAIILILALVGLLLLIFSFVRFAKKKSVYHQQSASFKTLFLHQVILMYFKLLGTPREAYETHMEYALRIDEHYQALHPEYAFSDIITFYEDITYGEYEVNEEEWLAYLEFKKAVEKYALHKIGFYKCMPARLKEFLLRY